MSRHRNQYSMLWCGGKIRISINFVVYYIVLYAGGKILQSVLNFLVYVTIHEKTIHNALDINLRYRPI